MSDEGFKDRFDSWKQTQACKTIDDLINIYRKWLYLEDKDKEFIEIIIAATLDREIPGDPVWLYVIAPPGGIKSELLGALGKSYSKAYTLDTLTEATFISGVAEKDKTTGEWVPVAGILQDLDGQTLIVKDFTTILNMNEDKRQEIYGQLRSIYDGWFEKAFGTMRRKISVKSKIGLVVGVTPIIDRYTKMHSIMGERFLKIRNDPDKLKTTFKALTNEGKEDQMRNELNAATKSYLDSLKFNPIPQLPDEIENQILKISYYTAFMRTNVWASYDDSGHVTDAEITNTEVPTRIAKQFKHLIRLIAVVRGKETPDEEDLNSIRRVARDTTEAKKQRIMDLLYKYGLNTPLTIGDIAGSVEGLYRSSAPNHLKIMGDLGILALNEKGEYFVKEEFREFVEAAYTSSPVTLQKKLNSSSFSEPEKEKKPNLANNIEQTSSYLAEVGYAVKEDDIFKFMEENLKLSRTDSVKVLGLMMRDGTIFSPRPGFYKRT